MARVRRIAVLRANAVGDFVVTLPALEALRRAYPRAHISLLGRRWHADFLDGRPGPVDEVVVLPDVPGVTVEPDAVVDNAQLAGFQQRLRERRFDLALQLHGGGRFSNPFVRSLGARVSAGLQAPGAQPLDRNLPYVDDHHPVALQLLECVALLGATATHLEPRLAQRPVDHAEADRLVPPDARPLVVLQPSATDPRRRWHPSRFATVADALARQGARIVLNGGPDDAPVNQSVVSAMQCPAQDLAGQLSLGGLTALLARAALLVSNDTGPVHLARALDVPTVTVYWIGNVRSFGPLSTRRHRVAVSWRVHCPVCGCHTMQNDCDHPASLVDDVDPSDVLDLALALFPRPAPSPPRTASRLSGALVADQL